VSGLLDLRAAEPDPAGVAVSLPITFACAGCGYQAPGDRPVPLRCPRARADDDIDHVMSRVLDAGRLSFPTGTEPNPFVRFRTLFHAYHLALSIGWTDAEYVGLVERLDAAVAAVDGSGFRLTPFARHAALSERLGFAHDGGVLIKDETGNVSGSHKARHLMGTLLELEIAEALSGGSAPRRRLAIASCGNAALAAAVLAAAADRELDVFIPPDAHPAVVDRLGTLGASLTVCEREPGVPGDPTYRRLRTAIDAGAVAFTCQGNENGFAIEGGLTLGWELATGLAAAGGSLDRLFVQVGGGALASACVGGLAEARRLGGTTADPAFHPVQSAAVAPLARAYERLVHRLDTDEPTDRPTDEAFAWAAQHRSAFMWPWETEPHSIATGILDDETYDWLAVVRGTLASGGWPVVVDETTLLEANDIATATTGIDVDPTGSAGLAGLLDLRRHGRVDSNETVAVIFTGVRRDTATTADTTDPSPGGPR
jgi:threonine synthase